MNNIQGQITQKTCKSIILAALFALALPLLSGCGAPLLKHSENKPLNPSTKRDLSAINPEIQALLDLKSDNPKINILIWTDKKNYNIGDEIVFFFRTNQDSYLSLFNVGSSGKLRRIFPNQAHQDKLFKSGKIHRIPASNSRFAIQAMGPLGIEHIKAIATPTPWFTAPSSENIDFSNISVDQTRGSESLQHALEKLKKLPWAEAEIEITVMEGNQTHRSPFGQERQMKPKPPEKPIDITGTPGRKPETRLSESKATQ